MDRYLQQALNMLAFCENDVLDPHFLSNGALAISNISSQVHNERSLKELHLRIRANSRVDSACTKVRQRYKAHLSGLQAFGEHELYKFVVDLFCGIDRGLLFNGALVSGSNRLQRAWLGNDRVREELCMPCWALHLTTAGRGLYVSEKQEMEAQPGTLQLIRPNVRMQQGLHPAAECWDHHWLLFQPRQHWLPWLNWQMSAPLSQVTLQEESRWQVLRASLDALAQFATEDPMIADDLAMNHLEACLIRLQPLRQETEVLQIDKRIQRVCEFISSNLERSLTLAEMAALSNLSESRLSHLFTRETGQSIRSWRNAERMKAARKALAFSEQSVAQVAAGVGYSDQLQFSKAFRKNSGCSPTQFRRMFA
jgi:AraC family transcriptional regulator of arabinose operon